MKEIYISCGSAIGMVTNTKNELRLKLEKLGYTVISNHNSLILPDLARINFISGILCEEKMVGIHADLLFYRYEDFYLNERVSQRFMACVLYDDAEVISRYIDSIIREDATDKLNTPENKPMWVTIHHTDEIKEAERKPLIFDKSRMECVCPRCERITDAPWDDSKSPFYCRYCGQKIIFPEK